ncbi:hypothetical protein AAFC00_002466 [Neodothiora populina]|uniref:4'-phosphopantetheinyl transferase domain-containing protein n=1 Tax=Neodothiora populina TaxID=2781224 RepID=A0ABR3P8J3_9PEZI
MTPRPFPLGLAIGTDICHYPRFLKYLADSSTTHDQNFTSLRNKPIAATTTTTQSTHVVDNNTASTDDSKTPPIADDVNDLQPPKSLFTLLNRIMTIREQREFWRRHGRAACFRIQSTADGEVRCREERLRIARYLGGRWAAKEAIIKACNSASIGRKRDIFMRDVEVRSEEGKAPFGVLIENRNVTESHSQKRYMKKARTGAIRSKMIWEQYRSRTAALLEERKLEQESNQPQDLSRKAPQGKVDLTLSKHQAIPTTLESEETPSILDDGQEANGSVTDEKCQPSKTPTETEVDIETWEMTEGQIVPVSISHDGDYVVATALAPTLPTDLYDAAVRDIDEHHR